MSHVEIECINYCRWTSHEPKTEARSEDLTEGVGANDSPLCVEMKMARRAIILVKIQEIVRVVLQKKEVEFRRERKDLTPPDLRCRGSRRIVAKLHAKRIEK